MLVSNIFFELGGAGFVTLKVLYCCSLFKTISHFLLIALCVRGFIVGFCNVDLQFEPYLMSYYMLFGK